MSADDLGRREAARFYDLATTNQMYGNVQAITGIQDMFKVRRSHAVDNWLEVPRMEAMFWSRLGYPTWSYKLKGPCCFNLGGSPYHV